LDMVAEILPPPKQQKAKELRQQGWSYRRIAKVLGVAIGTVYSWIGDEVFKTEHLQSDITITGADGKQYPAKIRCLSRRYRPL